jgi:DNA-binding response OmpR family regulator
MTFDPAERPDKRPDCENASRPVSRILVADDDPALRTMLAEALHDAGYAVLSAADGEEAWETLCRDSIDLLVTDHDMPRLTGLELLRRVRLGPLHVPVIFISGRMPGNVADLHTLLPPGIVLAKPFTLAELRADLESLLTPRPRPSLDAPQQGRFVFAQENRPGSPSPS